MNELEATRAKLRCLEMVEGTGLRWWEVVRVPYVKGCDPLPTYMPHEFNLQTEPLTNGGKHKKDFCVASRKDHELTKSKLEELEAQLREQHVSSTRISLT